ncbi:UDP-3-O-(3-hydroxymyristoyl)glucosamine N-acyltransferase [bioreactor metagenome]|uniref:serine O-acetyltransferase n=1 Tax=bioreactor metagenome TaxID=1076179 RepID=A0A645B1I1_9ZZZZ
MNGKHCHEFKLEPEKLGRLVTGLEASYADGYGVNLAEGANLPRRREILSVLDKIEALLFPGFEVEARYRLETISYSTGELLQQIYLELTDLCVRSFCYMCEKRNPPDRENCRIAEKSEKAVMALLEALPELREIAKSDVDAAYAGDPAARSKAEIIIGYPAIKAIEVQRVAHVLYRNEVPFIPRMMTEYAHSLTGIDIHPGAQLGRGFFIDHGTGVVIGETAVIGDHVRLYQGVTLGALSFPKDSCGMLVKGLRRHPTIEDSVIIYANATVLGDVTIGANSVLGGNVWITESLPPGTKVAVAPSEHKIKYRSPGA